MWNLADFPSHIFTRLMRSGFFHFFYYSLKKKICFFFNFYKFCFELYLIFLLEVILCFYLNFAKCVWIWISVCSWIFFINIILASLSMAYMTAVLRKSLWLLLTALRKFPDEIKDICNEFIEKLFHKQSQKLLPSFYLFIVLFIFIYL